MITIGKRILLVETDTEISEFILHQTLMPLGYLGKVVGSVSEAIQEVSQYSPDLIITDLHLPDLNGQDLMIALSSLGIEIPVVLLAKKSNPEEVMRTLKLGAESYLFWPTQDTEVVSAVEGALERVGRKHQDMQRIRELERRNEQLSHRTRELRSILAFGKAVTAISEPSKLFDKIVEGAVYLTKSDRGWLLYPSYENDSFVLGAYYDLPESFKVRINQPWDNEFHNLVLLSEEALSIHGEELGQFKVAKWGQAALAVPIKGESQLLGMLAVMRKSQQPYTAGDHDLIEALAGYSSIALGNVSLCWSLTEKVHLLQQTVKKALVRERSKEEFFRILSHDIRGALMVGIGYIEMLIDGQWGNLSEEQTQGLRITKAKLLAVLDVMKRQLGGQEIA